MYFKRTKSKCDECPLRDRTRVWGRGSKAEKIAIIGEAPGADEDYTGKPFVGRAGEYLEYGLRNANIRKDNVYLTNVIACRPEGNNINSEDAIKAQECCKEGFDEELLYLKSQGIKVLVPVGNTASNRLGIEENISRVRGSVYNKAGFTIMPTYHPSGIMRNVSKKSDGSVAYMKFIWIADLAKAKILATIDYKPLKENFILSPKLGDVQNWCIRNSGKLIAVDIETFRNKISVIGLAVDETNALSVPLVDIDLDPYWYNGRRESMKYALDQLFLGSPLMFQNALFDIPRLKAEGFAVPEVPAHDTMLLNHTISPELPHNLGFIVSIHGKTPYWKQRKNFNIDRDLWIYNLRDCVVLHQVLPSMLRDLKEMNTEKVYYEESLPLIAPIQSMMERGVLLSKEKLKNLKNTWKRKMNALGKKLKIKASLPESFNLNSDDDLRYFFFGIEPLKFKKLEKLKRYDEKYCKENKLRLLKTDTKIYEELLALQNMRDHAKPIYLPKTFVGRKTDSGKIKTDIQNLSNMKNKLIARATLIEKFKKPTYDHLQEKRAIEKLLSWLVDYFSYAKYQKLYTTYTKYKTDEESRVHTSFLIHGTASGRLSSRDPNLQNVPSPKKDPVNGKLARSIFISQEGYSFVSVDYTNLEVIVLAYVSNDRKLIDAFEKGKNIHDMNTKILFGLTPKDKQWKLARRAAKIFMFGGISYLGGDNEIFQKISIEVPELPFTLAQYKRAKENYIIEHPEYDIWIQKTKEEILDTRTVSNAFGRKRVLMGHERDIYKEGVNHKIQSSAAHIINKATIRIHERLREYKDNAFLVLQIHDELIVECKDKLIPDIVTLMKEEMSREVYIHNIKRTFPADAEVGKSLGELKEYIT